MQLFEKAADYQAFEQVLRDTLDQSPMRICAYAVMPNHWHPRLGGQTEFQVKNKPQPILSSRKKLGRGG